MRKKTIVSGIIILILALVILFISFPKLGNYFKNIFGMGSNERIILSQFKMSGEVSGVLGEWVTIQGTVGTDTKEIKFRFGPNTVLNKKVIKITAGDVNKGPFTPKSEISTGKFSDLVPGMKVLELQSKENLLSTDNVEAILITYIIYDIETPKQ